MSPLNIKTFKVIKMLWIEDRNFFFIRCCMFNRFYLTALNFGIFRHCFRQKHNKREKYFRKLRKKVRGKRIVITVAIDRLSILRDVGVWRSMRHPWCFLTFLKHIGVIPSISKLLFPQYWALFLKTLF